MQPHHLAMSLTTHVYCFSATLIMENDWLRYRTSASEKECFLFLHVLTSKPDHSRGLSPEKGIINHWCPFIHTHTHATLHIHIRIRKASWITPQRCIWIEEKRRHVSAVIRTTSPSSPQKIHGKASFCVTWLSCRYTHQWLVTICTSIVIFISRSMLLAAAVAALVLFDMVGWIKLSLTAACIGWIYVWLH